MLKKAFIGNDIVALTSPAAKGKSNNSRFIDRICSRNEKSTCLDSEDPDRTLWTFWAMKEASYKAIVKVDPQIRFNPRFFECPTFENCTYQGLQTTITLIQSKDFVCAIAIIGQKEESDLLLFTTKVIEGDANESLEVRNLSLSLLNDAGYPGCTIHRLEKGDRLQPPMIFMNHKHVQEWDISLSHDESYIATTLLLANR